MKTVSLVLAIVVTALTAVKLTVDLLKMAVHLVKALRTALKGSRYGMGK